MYHFYLYSFIAMCYMEAAMYSVRKDEWHRGVCEFVISVLHIGLAAMIYVDLTPLVGHV